MGHPLRGRRVCRVASCHGSGGVVSREEWCRVVFCVAFILPIKALTLVSTSSLPREIHNRLRRINREQLSQYSSKH